MKNVSIDEIKEKIKSEVAQLCGIDKQNIRDSDLLVEDLGANSVVIVQLYSSCQEEYGIDLSSSLNLSEPLSIEMMSEIVYRQINNK